MPPGSASPKQYYVPGRRPLVGGPTLGVPNPAGDILKRLTGGRSKTVDAHGLPIGTLNIEGLRRMLIAHGYHIPASGNGVGKVMKSALGDFLNPKKFDSGGPLGRILTGTHITGARDPEAWNKRFGLADKDRSVVTLPPSKTLDSKGNSQPGNAEQRTPGGNGGTVNLQGLTRIAQQTGIPIPTSLANKLAEAEAGAQFDPQIHDVQGLLAQAPTDSAQHQHDIGHWYGQVQKALGTAGTRDTAATNAGVGSMKDALAAITASLGGAANAGAADVGAAGLNDIGTLQALGTSQDMLNNDLAPVVDQEKAAAATNQLNTDALAKSKLQQQLEDLQGQRGQTLSGTRASTLMQILGQNNQLAQQQFQDNMSVQQAGEAAQLNGLKALYYANKGNAPVRGSFGYATPSDINNVQNAVLSHILDANGNLKPGITMPKAVALARTVAGTYFPNGGLPQGWAQSVVSPYFNG